MKQLNRRAFWLILAGVGMAAVAVVMFLAAERLKKSGMDKKPTGTPSTEVAQILAPFPAPVEAKPIVQAAPSTPEKTKPPAVKRAEEPPVELQTAPSPRYVYVENSLEKGARDYDANGQIGDPPAGWKEDYSHWDSENWGMPLEKLGTLYPNGKVDYSVQPFKLSAEGNRLLMEELESIRQEKGEEAAKEFISDTPKTGLIRLGDEYIDRGYMRVEVESGKTVYAALSLFDVYGYRILGNRFRQFSSPNNFSVAYYRRHTDGALMRDIYMSDKGAKEFIAAPPPDMSQYTDAQIEALKRAWRGNLEALSPCYF